MTSIRKLALALCLATFFSYSNAQQIDTTGNLINNNNWSGAVYGADPGGCCASISGSGPLYDTTTDTIMFSYGQSTVSQTIGINQALGGTGIQVHGYNFSWQFRYISNNTTQNDSLVFNVALRDSSGSVVESQNYSLDGMTILYDAWYTSSNTYTYNNPYLDPQSITLNISGRDGGFWAGYYGPEVKNVSLSVNYSFDPCAADPLYSSSCAGYWEAWFAQFCLFWCPTSSEPEVDVAAVDYTLVPSTTTSTISIPEETTTGEVKIDAGGIELSTTGELQVPDGIPEEVREKKPVDMNLIMSIVREATDDSKALSVVNQSIQDSMSGDANPDFSMTNETLSSIGRQQELSAQQSILENQELNQTSMINSSAAQDNHSDQTVFQGSQDESKTESIELQNQSLPRPSNNDKTEVTQTVNKNAQDNEAAGGVSIDALAQSPIDFNSYLNQQMQDSQFYASRDIYRGQVNVDNVRALRGLGTDRLHQEMVDQQYNQGVK